MMAERFGLRGRFDVSSGHYYRTSTQIPQELLTPPLITNALGTNQQM